MKFGLRKKSSQWLTLALIAIMLFGMSLSAMAAVTVQPNPSAATKTVLSIPNSTTSFTSDIVVDDSGWAGMDFVLHYDPTIIKMTGLTAVNATGMSLAGNTNFGAMPTQALLGYNGITAADGAHKAEDIGYVKMTWSEPAGENVGSGASSITAGTMFRVAFSVIGTGSSTIELLPLNATTPIFADNLASAVTIAATPGTVTVTSAPVAVTGVTLDKATSTITVGNTDTLTATVAPANAANKNVSWSTSNSAVATVANGVVTGVAAGNAVITVTTADGSFTATCNVTVTAAPTVAVTGVTLNKATSTILIGATDTLTATVAPANATNKNVSWSTSNSSVATVANGVVTGVGAGSAVITVTTTDGNRTATCAFTVNAAPAGALSVTVADAAGFLNNGKTQITLPTPGSGNSFKYQLGTVAQAVYTPNTGDSTATGWTAIDTTNSLIAMITATNGQHIGIAEVNGSGLVVKFVDVLAQVIDETAPFTISGASKSTATGFIKATASINKGTGTGSAVVVFQLMNGTTPAGIVAIEKSFTTTPEAISAIFPCTTTGTVTVMVLDTLTTSTTQNGTLQAVSQTL